jgi:pimeloyl-ACP methyl ester carboxylesterase
MAWSHIERGEGRPLVLGHGIGCSWQSWTPVLDRLAQRRRVIAFDLPGFGATPALHDGDGPPTPMRFAELLPGEVTALGIDEFDYAGFSMGGWIGLELAKAGAARSVVAVNPTGLWTRCPGWTRWVLDRAYKTAVNPPSEALDGWLDHAAGRTALMSAYYSRPWRLTPEFARESSAVLATSTDFERALDGLARNRFSGGRDIAIPLTVAFSSRDWIHPPVVARRRDELPASVSWIDLRGCGHMAQADDPELVASVILAGTE